MTKIDAIIKVMEDNGGTANWQIIYDNICKYYPSAKDSEEWQAGLRGVLYREIRTSQKPRLKKIGLSIFALTDYKEEGIPKKKDATRMHSFIEGICLELGNFNKYLTYTADPSAVYRDNIRLSNVATMRDMPSFSYNEIVCETKRIDVVWFNNKGLAFPKKVFEVVDSIGTLNGAFNRSLQLNNFLTEFYIVAPEKHREKYLQTIDLEVYQLQKERFNFINYEEIIDLYETTARKNQIENKIFGV